MLEARWENFVSRKNIDWKCLQLEKKIVVSLNAQREGAKQWAQADAKPKKGKKSLPSAKTRWTDEN